MKNRFRLIRRGERGAKFYCVDTATGKRTALGTADVDTAQQIVLAKNQALRQPTLNLHIAKAYLAGSDSGVATRTWQNALDQDDVAILKLAPMRRTPPPFLRGGGSANLQRSVGCFITRWLIRPRCSRSRAS